MRGDFSAAERTAQWDALEKETFDVLVIGAGITGSGIARDAAGRGLSVALIDGGDIGGGTSSRSSRLVHGGLRYLETLDFDLVFEALRERRRLLELAPHLVHPLSFLFPVYTGDATGVLKLGAGMWLYETLSLFRSPRRHRILRPASLLDEEPNLRSTGLRGGALYYDAQVDDARLTLAVARAAYGSGATVLNHTAATELSFDRPSGAAICRVQDRVTGQRATVNAHVVVNATGPWSDHVRALADPDIRPRLRPTKGVHILIRRERLANRNAIIFRSPVDGRVMFLLPWGRFAYVGTTDTEFSGDPSEVVAEPEDIDYLLASANSIFPRAGLNKADVVSTWAGVRPLLAPSEHEQLSESATSREHDIWRDPSGLVNIAGGKLTTYRSMAAEATDSVALILRDEFGVACGECYTELLPLPGSGETDTPVIRDRASRIGISSDTLSSLQGRHGSDVGNILGLIESDAELAAPIVDDHPYLLAEAVHAVRNEMAVSLEDVLRRRLQLFYESADGGLGAARRVAELIAKESGLEWGPEAVEAQVQSYGEAVHATRPGAQA